MVRDAISREALKALITDRIERGFARWNRMAPEVWAEEVYRLPNGQRFRWDYAPFAKGMFMSLWDPRAQETVYQCFSRGFKTTCTLLAAGYAIDQAPRRILWMWQTVGHAEKFSKEGLGAELFDTTPCLGFLSGGNRRLSSNTITFKRYPGGSLNLFGANAPGELRRSKGNLLIADEIDAYEQTETDEGEILTIFDKRGAEYPDTIRVKASYPSLKGHSRVQALLEASDFNEWHVTCVACGGEPFVMHRSQLRYEKDRPETARLECPRCKALLTDAQRYAMAHKQGFDNWKPRNAFRGRHGFHANAMLWPHAVDEKKYPGGALAMIATEEIAAENAPDPRRQRRVIVNTFDAEPFDPSLETEKPPDWHRLFAQREDYVMVPRRAVVLTAFVDVQVNRLEVEWKAWAQNEESWGIAHMTLDGNTREIDVWNRLIRELQRKFPHESGAKIGLSMCFVDGGWAAEWVYLFMQRMATNPPAEIAGKVRATKGIGKHGEPIMGRKWATIAKNLKGYHIGTWQAKDDIYARLRMKREEGEPYPARWMHHPMTYGENYFQQLTSEVVEIDYEKGEEVRKYVNPNQARNEGLDLAVGNLAAFKLRTWNFEAMRAELEAQVFETKEAVNAPPVAVAAGGGGSWAADGMKW